MRNAILSLHPFGSSFAAFLGVDEGFRMRSHVPGGSVLGMAPRHGAPLGHKAMGSSPQPTHRRFLGVDKFEPWVMVFLCLSCLSFRRFPKRLVSDSMRLNGHKLAALLLDSCKLRSIAAIDQEAKFGKPLQDLIAPVPGYQRRRQEDT